MSDTLHPDQRGAYLALICYHPEEPEEGDPEQLYAALTAMGANSGSNTVRCALITHAETGTCDHRDLVDAFEW